MAKVTWGIDADTIANAEGSSFIPYDGPVPPNGVYGVAFKKIEATTSSTDKPMIKVLAVIDGSIGQNKKEYDDCPLWDQIVVGSSTDWKVKQFLDGIGATAKEFVTGTVTDKDGNITKIGSVTFTEGKRFKVQVKKGKDKDGNIRAEIGSYLPLGTEAIGSKGASEPEPDFDEEVTEEEEGGEEWTWADIADLDRAEMKALIKDNGLEIKVLPKIDDEALRALIAEALEIEAEEAEEEEAEEEETEGVDLDALDRDGLKALIKEQGLEVKVLKSDTEESLREKVAAALGTADGDEEEEEEEGEPPF